MNESQARLDEIEQKMARKGSGEGDERKSLGEMATEGTEAEIAALASSRGRVSMEVKIGSAHVCTPVTNAQHVCSPMLENKHVYHLQMTQKHQITCGTNKNK